jgi:hypothetical protein
MHLMMLLEEEVHCKLCMKQISEGPYVVTFLNALKIDDG